LISRFFGPKTVNSTVEKGAFSAFSYRQAMGFNRSHWEFYRGFGLIISIQLVVMAAIAWQLSRIAGRSPKQALPMAIMLLVGGIGLAVLAWMFFFGAPIVMSFLAVVCSAVVVILSVMGKEELGQNGGVKPATDARTLKGLGGFLIVRLAIRRR
jgi:hypothetical protein